MKIKLRGTRIQGKVQLSGFSKEGFPIRSIPPYFEIEIETDKIKERKKGE